MKSILILIAATLICLNSAGQKAIEKPAPKHQYENPYYSTEGLDRPGYSAGIAAALCYMFTAGLTAHLVSTDAPRTEIGKTASILSIGGTGFAFIAFREFSIERNRLRNERHRVLYD